MSREQYMRLVLDSVDDQDNESTGENRHMLAFFDSLIQRESLGDLGDAMDDTSEDSDTLTGPRVVNFDRWSDVDSSEGAEEGEMVRDDAQDESSSSGGEEEDSSDKRLPHHPANGVVSRLRRKMKYR